MIDLRAHCSALLADIRWVNQATPDALAWARRWAVEEWKK